MQDEAIVALDLRGLKCPYPVIKTENRMASLPKGGLISVETTDPLSSIDLPHFCAENGHALISLSKTDAGHVFLIRKAL